VDHQVWIMESRESAVLAEPEDVLRNAQPEHLKQVE